jgi:hypothetical protein
MVSINFSLRANNQLIHQLCSLECHSWFRKSESSLPKPLKPPIIGNVSSSVPNGNLRLETERSNLVTAREDRRSYKNISIYVTELPPTPTLWVPRNSPPSAYQKGEGSSPPLPQTPERSDSRTPSWKPTPRKSNQSGRHYWPSSTEYYGYGYYSSSGLPSRYPVNVPMPPNGIPTHQYRTPVNSQISPTISLSTCQDQPHVSSSTKPTMSLPTYQNQARVSRETASAISLSTYQNQARVSRGTAPAISRSTYQNQARVSRGTAPAISPSTYQYYACASSPSTHARSAEGEAVHQLQTRIRAGYGPLDYHGYAPESDSHNPHCQE